MPFLSGSVIGTLGGLIGLGGAEFRLPLLISVFRFPPLEAIILNKATSLIVVASALVFRTTNVPCAYVLAHGDVVLSLRLPDIRMHCCCLQRLQQTVTTPTRLREAGTASPFYWSAQKHRERCAIDFPLGHAAAASSCVAGLAIFSTALARPPGAKCA